MTSWEEFIQKYLQTLGITLAFAFGGAGLLMWSSKETYTASRALLVVVAALALATCTTAFVLGYLGWSIFAAPFIGIVCGLVALPVLMGVAKAGERLGLRVPDVVDKYVPVVTKTDPPAFSPREAAKDVK